MLSEWMILLVTLFGTMFLLGELLVNMRGLFALMGIGFITVYFASCLSLDMVVIMILVYLLGMVLIIIDGKLINDGTLAVIGLVVMIMAVGLSAPGWVAGLYSVIGVLTGGASSFLFLKVFKRRAMWSKIALMDQLSSEKGYNSLKGSLKDLVDEEGVAMTDMRPVGTIQVNGEEYSGVSNGKWIFREEPVKVVSVDGTKILVKKLENE